MNLDIKELQMKLNEKYGKEEPSVEYFGGLLPSDNKLLIKELQGMFLSREQMSVKYINDLDKFISKATIKSGVQQVALNKELVEKVSKLLDIFPEFQSTGVNPNSMNMNKFIEFMKLDMDSFATKMGLTILLTLWFLMPFIGMPALFPLMALWSDKKDKINTDDLDEAVDILIGLLMTAYNKAFDKNMSYNKRNFSSDSKKILNDFNKLLLDKALLEAAKGKKVYKLDTSEKLLLINAIKTRMSLFKAFVGTKPSKNINIAKKLSKLLTNDSIEKLGTEFTSKITWCIDVIGLLDKLQDTLHDCIISMSKDVFLIMA